MKQVTNQNSRVEALIKCVIKESQAVNALAEQMKAEGYVEESLKELLRRNRETILISALCVKEATTGNAKVHPEFAGLPDDAEAEWAQMTISRDTLHSLLVSVQSQNKPLVALGGGSLNRKGYDVETMQTIVEALKAQNQTLKALLVMMQEAGMTD